VKVRCIRNASEICVRQICLVSYGIARIQTSAVSGPILLVIFGWKLKIAILAIVKGLAEK
jgi:hypothetical protein